MVAEIAFWSALALVWYVYLGYPVLLVLLGAVRARPIRKAGVTPSVSLVVSAYNEESVIEAKVRNSLALDYPSSALEIVVISDGSTDLTEQVARRYQDDPRVRVIAFPVNRGKLAALNDVVPLLRGEIIVFSDAASMLERDAVRQLVGNFADPDVGAASGVYVVVRQDQARLGKEEATYWRYETFLKAREAAVDSIIGAHGSLYAIRASLYPFPACTEINDDFLIPLRIVQQGYRVAYDPQAVAREEAREMGGFSRRVRIMTGNVLQLRELRRLLRPLRPFPLLFMISHKAGRLAIPVALLALGTANLFLLESAFYASIGVAQSFFYLLVLGGALGWPRSRVLGLPYYFCMANAAVFLGVYYTIRGNQRVAWKRRAEEPVGAR